MESRAVRSYKLRGRRITEGQQEAWDRLWPIFGIEFAEKKIDLAKVFPHSNRIIMEIGFGMGESTAAIALAHPERNFLGAEVYPAGVGSLLRQIDEAGLSNLRIIQHDAIDVLTHMILPESLAAVHVFFPDPWPKARHHKRRLIRPEVVALIASRLAPGGVLHCATDWAHYALQMLQVLSSEPLLENTAGEVRLSEEIADARGFAERPAYRPPTKFERRGLALGHGVWDLVMTRRFPG